MATETEESIHDGNSRASLFANYTVKTPPASTLTRANSHANHAPSEIKLFHHPRSIDFFCQQTANPSTKEMTPGTLGLINSKIEFKSRMFSVGVLQLTAKIAGEDKLLLPGPLWNPERY